MAVLVRLVRWPTSVPVLSQPRRCPHAQSRQARFHLPSCESPGKTVRRSGGNTQTHHEIGEAINRLDGLSADIYPSPSRLGNVHNRMDLSPAGGRLPLNPWRRAEAPLWLEILTPWPAIGAPRKTPKDPFVAYTSSPNWDSLPKERRAAAVPQLPWHRCCPSNGLVQHPERRWFHTAIQFCASPDR